MKQRYIVLESVDGHECSLHPWFDLKSYIAQVKEGDGQKRLMTHDTDDLPMHEIATFYADDWDAAVKQYNEILNERDT